MAIRQYTDTFGKKRFEVKVSLRSKKNPTIRFRKVETNIETLKRAEGVYKKLREFGFAELARRELHSLHWGNLVDRWELELKAGTGAKRGVSYHTAEDYSQVLRNYTADWWKTPADQIPKSKIRSVLESVNDNVSHSRMKRVKTALDGIFTWAIDSGLITSLHSSPVAGISFNKRVEEKRPEILTLSEVRKFLEHAKTTNHKWYPIWCMALMTGMRSGELYALEWEDIEWENRKVNVHKSYNKKIRKMGPTKAGYWRDVPMSKELEGFLKGIQATCQGRKSVLPRFSDWEKGRGAYVLRTFLIGVGLPSIRFHALRACFATQLLKDAIAPAVVMKVCGWKDLKTMQRYIRMAGIEIEGATDQLKILPDDQVMGRVVDLFDFKG